MKERAILALDQGTTGSTALVVGASGRILGRAYSEFSQHFPQPGWVEHDAEEIHAVTLKVGREALAAANEAAVEGIGITNQRETVVLWDPRTLVPVARAIVWQDRRTAAMCRRLKEDGLEDEYRRRTGLVLDPYFSGTKIAWLLESDPELRRRAEAGEIVAGTIDSWLIARLTGGAVHATDPTNASRTLLYDLDSGRWEADLAGPLGVPLAMLPEVRHSSGDFGIATAEAFGEELPIRGVAGDQQSALFGQGCFSAGQAKNTYGTGAFLLMNTGTDHVVSRHGLLTTAACGAMGEPAFALEGSVFIAGAAIQWLRDGLGLIESAAETEALAAGIDSTEGVSFVPAFAGLGAPHWNPEARGTITGLTRGTMRAHLVRAALESMAVRTAEVLEARASDSGHPLAALTVDGGVASNGWLMGFQAGVLGVPVHRPSLLETTAIGAAGLAGLATGIWSTGQEFVASRSEPTVFEPAMAREERTRRRSEWNRAMATALHWANAQAGGE